MLTIRIAMTGCALMLLSGSPVFAADTARVFNSGLLVLLFVGFCTLLIVVQVLPAILSVLGMTKNAAENVVDAQLQAGPAKKR